MIQKFKENIGFLVNSKQDKLEKLCLRVSTHDSSDVIPLTLEIKEELNEILGKKFNKHDYITRQNNLGRKHFAKLLSLIPEGITNPIDPLKKIIKSDIFWDKIKDIRKVNSEEFVFDISVPECENFICENIVAHNTLELPVETFDGPQRNIHFAFNGDPELILLFPNSIFRLPSLPEMGIFIFLENSLAYLWKGMGWMCSGIGSGRNPCPGRG